MDKENSVRAPSPNGARPIGCDQVAWLLDIFDRYLPPSKHPRISREREMLMYGMLYEVMDIAGLNFSDDNARRNGTPHFARDYRAKDEDWTNEPG
jgi:hypothetical protein